MRRRRALSGSRNRWPGPALGFGAGLVAGFVLGEWTGRGQPGARPAGGSTAPRGRAAPAHAGRARCGRSMAALRAEPRLAGAPHRGRRRARAASVELHGWVPTARARAARRPGRARGARASTSVINRILVRGEDDRRPAERAARHRPERMTEPLAPNTIRPRSRPRSTPGGTSAGLFSPTPPRRPRPRAALRHHDAAAQRDGGSCTWVTASTTPSRTC